MTSSKPYLVRALNEWILDNGLTPYMLVDATVEGTQVPREHVRDGEITLNISPQAVTRLSMTNEFVGFSARFGGVSRQILVPAIAVRAIFARENGQGMVFPPEPDEPLPPDAGNEPGPAGSKGKKTGKPAGDRPRFRVVK